jgi:hypothetical protein
MSDFTDGTLGRYLEQQPGMREALHVDPLQHAQTELMRQLLDGAERAMADEGVPEEARRRVINRVVWGEPEGLIDVHAQRREAQERAAATWSPPVDEYRLSSRPGFVFGVQWARHINQPMLAA